MPRIMNLRRLRADGPRAAPPATPDQLGPWKLIRHAPRPVWLVTALFALILAGWSVLAPLYHAADEPNHADAVMRLVEGYGWPAPATARVTDQGVGAIAASPYGTKQQPLALTIKPIPAAAAPGRHDRPTWKELRALPDTSGKLLQQLTQHPPGYYWYEAVILRAAGATGWRWDIAVSTMRLLSALLVVWLPLLSWATAWRITGSRRAGIIASIVPLGVPELTHVGASVNNDNLVTLAGATVLLGVACALLGDRSRTTALWTGLWLAVALWAKAFGLVLVPLVFLAYLIPWGQERWRTRGARTGEDERRRLRHWRLDRLTGIALLLSAGIGIGLGCWYYVINEVRYGSTQPGVPGFPPGRYIDHQNVLFLRYLTQLMLGRWWGSMGWYEVSLPWRLVILATVVVAGISLVGLLRRRGRRIALLLLLWPTVLAYLLVVADVSHYYLTTHYVRGLSGRYLFVGFSGVAALVGAGCAALPRRLARWSPLAVLVGALAMQAEAVHLAINSWWRPVGGTLRQAWAAFSAWSTWPVGVLFTGLALLAIVTVWALVSFAVMGVQADRWDSPLEPADTGRAIAASLEPASLGDEEAPVTPADESSGAGSPESAAEHEPAARSGIPPNAP